jgi:hypothetical protein
VLNTPCASASLVSSSPKPITSSDALSDALSEIQRLGTDAAKVWPWSRPDWESVFNALEEKASSYVDGLIGSTVSEDDKASEPASKTSLIIDVIKARREKLALTSSTTDQIVGICKQILAFGAAGLALSVGFSEKLHTLNTGIQKVIVLTGIFYVELVVISLVVLVCYLLQAHFRYPFLYFKKIGNAWPYFYYASVSREVSRFPIQTARKRVLAGKKYAEDFVRFAERCLNETPKDRLRTELQQYFLLISYQGYVQQFSLRLANLFFYGFVGAALSTTLIWVWSAVR